jgi:hypothetical protein
VVGLSPRPESKNEVTELPDRPRLSRAERERRDEKVLRLFLTGLTYREIGAAVGLRSVSGVHRVVQRELAAGARRRGVLTEDAFDVWQERTEALFQVHWERALDGDYRSAELCRKLLAQQARVYGLGADGGSSLPAPTQTVGPGEDEPQDELSKLRAARGR